MGRRRWLRVIVDVPMQSLLAIDCINLGGPPQRRKPRAPAAATAERDAARRGAARSAERGGGAGLEEFRNQEDVFYLSTQNEALGELDREAAQLADGLHHRGDGGVEVLADPHTVEADDRDIVRDAHPPLRDMG